jgi:hypothetical protein
MNTAIRQLNGSSLGITASGRRNIKTGTAYNKYFNLGALKGTDPVVSQSGSVFDTLKHMDRIVRSTTNQTKAIASHLYSPDVKTFASKIWHFIYNHIQYKKDSILAEEIREPARTWKDRRTGVDCDCYSVFISSILTNKGIPHSFRMAGYGGDYQHVYVVIPQPGGEIIIDPVVDRFNYQKPITKKYDYTMLPIKQLNGVTDPFISGTTGAISGLQGLGSSYCSLNGGVSMSLGSALGVIPFGSEFDILLSGLGSTDDLHYRFLTATKVHLINTMAMIEADPALAHAAGLEPHSSVMKIKKLLAAWDNPILRDQLLDSYSASEGLSGLGALDGFFQKLGRGIKQATQWVGSSTKQAAGFVGEKLKDVGQAIVRYNPVTLVLRGAIMAQLKTNAFNLAGKAGYGYWSDTQARAAGFDLSEHAKFKQSLARLAGLWKGLQGKSSNLKSAILQGWEKGVKKRGWPYIPKHYVGTNTVPSGYLKGLDGVGFLPVLVVPIAAAVSAIKGTTGKGVGEWLKKIFDVFKSVNISRLFKRKVSDGVTAEEMSYTEYDGSRIQPDQALLNLQTMPAGGNSILPYGQPTSVIDKVKEFYSNNSTAVHIAGAGVAVLTVLGIVFSGSGAVTPQKRVVAPVVSSEGAVPQASLTGHKAPVYRM